MPSSFKDSRNTRLQTVFVKTSTNWFSDFTNGNFTILASNFSLIKWLSISTYLVQSCWNRLWTICIAARLSQYKFISSFGWYPISLSKPFNQRSSHRPFDMPRNSASALDKVTTFYFLLFQVIRFPPMKVKYSDVDLLSELSAQSASMYPSIFKWLWFLNMSSLPGDDFK